MQVYKIEVSIIDRSLAFKNTQGELVAFAVKSTKDVITSVLVGCGSEMIVDVAPGVDWTTICACMMLVQQVRHRLLSTSSIQQLQKET